MDISKAALLGHSWVFNEFLKEKKIGTSSNFLVENNLDVYQNSWKLIDCLTRKPMTIDELHDKVSFISKRIWDLKGIIEDLTEDLEHNVAGSDAMGLGYVQAEQNESKADDTSS